MNPVIGEIYDQLDQLGNGANFFAMSTTRSILNIYDAKTHLSSLIERSLAGEEIVIARRGKALVRLVPVEAEALPRKPSPLMTIHWVSDDFDAPDPAFEAQFYNGETLPE
jgi:prevent-host-death family protein